MLSNCCMALPVDEICSDDLGYCSRCREGAVFNSEKCNDCDGKGVIPISTFKGRSDVYVCDSCFDRFYWAKSPVPTYR